MASTRRALRACLRWLTTSLLLLAALFASLGCGLDEYESRIKEQRKRLDYLKQEYEAVSTDPLEWPGNPEKVKDDLSPNDFYMRPPKGVSTKFDEKASRTAGMFVFKGEGGPIRDMFVAGKKSSNAPAFEKSIRELLKIGADAKKADFVAGPENAPIKLERITEKKKLSNPSGNLDLFIQRGGDMQVAIAFKSDDSKEAASQELAYRLALGTLRTGDKAANPPIPYRPPGAAKKKAAGGK